MKFLTLLEKLYEDEIIKNSVKDVKLKEIADVIEEYIKTESINEQVCYDFYKQLKVPYSVVYRAFGLLKSEIKDINTHEKLNKLLNITAKMYIKKEALTLQHLILQKTKHDFLLFKAHENWIKQIVEAIKSENLEKFPLKDAKHCKFKEYLSYLESLMICIDVKMCVYIHDLHNMVHTLANSFYIFYKNANYAEAYFVFKDFKEQILKFYNLLSELYISTFANVESSFFKLIEILVKSKTLFIALIDLKNLKKMNQLFNENVITDAKRALYFKLNNLYKGSKNFLIIQGFSNDFYFVGTDIDYNEFEKEINNIKTVINESIRLQKYDIKFEANILGVKLDRYSQIKINDLINYFSYMKKIAVKEHRDILLNDKENHLDDWLKEQLDKKYIKNKLENGDVDVMFQPIFKSDGLEIFSLEVLGRIVENDKLIPAGMFIDQIYEMGKIAKFDSFVLDKTLEKEELIRQVSNRIFLNISFESLANKEYVEKLHRVIEKMNVDIVLELTEQRFVENLELIEKINKETDTYFAVDDFGSGYSSILLVINLLKKNLIKILKIDGSLVKGIKDDEFLKKAIKIIVGFRKEFGLHLVAEFVEDEDTLEFLKEAGVDLVQGYYLSMPKTIEELLIEKKESLREIIT